MTRVLVVNHDVDLADNEVESLRRRGYDVRICLGPIGGHCPVLAGGPCSLVSWADVMVYDAWATGEPDGAMDLIGGLRQHHPEVPIVVTASGIEPHWIELTGPLAVTPLVGAPDGDRLAAAIDGATASAEEARSAFFG